MDIEKSIKQIQAMLQDGRLIVSDKSNFCDWSKILPFMVQGRGQPNYARMHNAVAPAGTLRR